MHLGDWTVIPTDQKLHTDIHIIFCDISDGVDHQGQGSKVKVTKVKNVKILIFGLLSEKKVRCQSPNVKVKGQSQKSRSKVQSSNFYSTVQL